MVALRPVRAVADAVAASDYYAMVTPADTDLPFITRAVYVYEDGTLSVTRPDGTVVAIPTVAGSHFIINAIRIRSTGTSGITSVLAYY